MNKRIKNYQEKLLQELQDPTEAQAYLNAALSDEDPRIFLLALKNVIESQNQAMSDLAQKTNLNRENLYRMFSLKGNPKISSIIPILNALGLQLAVQPYKHK
ncbi:MAG: addiction module antidote protein [Candidatus Babeliales bacterium]